MRNHRVWLSILAALLVASFLVTGCGSKSATTTTGVTTTAAPKVFKIGVIGPLTGPVALWGNIQQMTVTMMAEQVNAAGGLDIGGQKYTLQVISEDDGADPTKSATAANKLVLQDKVQVIVGAILPTSTNAVRTVTEANEVLLFAVSGASHLGAQYPFTIQATDTLPAIGVNFDVISKHGIKTIARVGALGINEEWQKWEDGYAKMYGLTVLNPGINVIDQGVQDFTPEISKLLALKPDALHSSGLADGPYGLFIKQARQLGWKGPITSNSLTSPPVAAGIAGVPNMENVEQGVWITEGPMAPPGVAKLQADFVARWGQDKWDQAAISWSVMVPTIVAGLKKAGTTDTAELVDGILTSTIEVPVGQLVFGGGEIYGAPRMAYMSGLGAGFWKDGKFVIEVTHSAQKTRDDQAKAFTLKTK